MKLFFIKLFFRKLIFLSSKMLDWLFVCPQDISLLDWGCFPSRNREGTLDDHVLEIQKKKFAADTAKMVLRTAPAEGSSSWTVHDLVIRSWPAHEQDHQIIKKNDISWSSSWSREPLYNLLMNWFTNARVRDFRTLRSSSSTTNPVCERPVDLLVCSLPLHRHSYIGFILTFSSSIHNKQKLFHHRSMLCPSSSTNKRILEQWALHKPQKIKATSTIELDPPPLAVNDHPSVLSHEMFALDPGDPPSRTLTWT